MNFTFTIIARLCTVVLRVFLFSKTLFKSMNLNQGTFGARRLLMVLFFGSLLAHMPSAAGSEVPGHRVIPVWFGALAPSPVASFVEAHVNGLNGVTGLSGISDVAVSPDGKFVYTASYASNAVSVFERNFLTGKLTYSSTITGIVNAFSVAVSPDNKSVYVASPGGQVYGYDRDQTTGALTAIGSATGSPTSGFVSVSISDDGKWVYGVGGNPSGVVVFGRDMDTGAITLVQDLQDNVAGYELGQYFGPVTSPIKNIATSADGQYVYLSATVDNAISLFAVNETTGQLTQQQVVKDGEGGIDGIQGASSLILSPNGRFLYVSGQGESSIALFSVNQSDGTLAYIGKVTNGVDGVDHLVGARSLAMSPDGRYLFVSAITSDAVSSFECDPATGLLTLVSVAIQSVDGVSGLDGPSGMVTDRFSRHLYVAGQLSHSLVVFALPVPAVELTVTELTVPYNGAATPLDSLLNVYDADSENLASATIIIEGGLVDTDLLTVELQGGISGTYDNTTGTLSLTGIASLTQYRDVLRTVRFKSGEDAHVLPGSYSTRAISIDVSDGENTSGAASIAVRVERPSNTAPLISGTPATTVYQDSAYSFIPTADDIDGDTLAYSIVNKPDWADFDATTGELSGTPGNGDVGTTTGVVISVSDGTLAASLPAFNLEVLNVNNAPTISGTPATTVHQDSAYSFIPTADDIDGDTLAYSIVNKPDWADFDTATGELSGTPGNGDAGTTTGIVISVSDGTLSASLAAFNLEVLGASVPPDTTAPQVFGVVNGEVYDTTVVPTFNEGLATLNGLPFTSGTSIAAIGNYELVVTDTAGNSTVVDFAIASLPQAPTGLRGIPGNKQVNLTWQVPNSGGLPITNYVIEYSADGGQNWINTQRDSLTTTRAVLIGLDNNRPYQFRVAAVNAFGKGAFSDVLTGVIPTEPMLDSGGNLPEPAPGETVVITNGKVEAITLEVVDSEFLRLKSDGYALELASFGVDGERIPISSIDAVIRLVRATGAEVYLSGYGFEPGTVVTAYLFSEPELVGHLPVGTDGAFAGTLAVPLHLETGSHTLQVSGIVAGGDGGERSLSIGLLLVDYKPQEIGFDALAAATYGDDPVLLDAAATSGLPVMYSVTDVLGNGTDVATIANNRLHIHATGDVLITATQAGDLEYAAAAPVSRTLSIGKAPLTVTALPQTKAYGAADPALVYTHSGLVGEDGATVLSGGLERSNGEAVGKYAITQGSLSAGANYSITFKGSELTVTPAPRTLDFPALPKKTYGQEDFAAGAVSSSGERVSYTSSNTAVAEITDGGLIRIIGGGEAVITAKVPENSNYAGRTEATQLLMVNKAQQTIVLNAPATVLRDAGSVTLEVAASSGLPVSLQVSNEQVASLNGTTLHIHRLGTVRISAVQAGNDNYEATEPVSVTVQVINPSADMPIQIHRAVSPNGDGINEYLTIEAIEDYPENRVQVFNRNGTVVYQASGYNNSTVAFRGIGAGQQKLPAGTYFYITEIRVNGEWKSEKGWFVLRY